MSTTPPSPQHHPIRFVRRGEIVTLHDVPPTRTLLEVLREDLHCTGTKEGCNEGDCGACTVVVGESVNGELQTKAVNSCIKMAHSVDGMALWTVEDIAADDGRLQVQPVPWSAEARFVMPLSTSFSTASITSDASLSSLLFRQLLARPIFVAVVSVSTVPLSMASSGTPAAR